MRSWRKLTYNGETERWEIHMDGWFDALHCGESLKIRIGETAIPCRIECDRDWYVIMSEARFNLKIQFTYQVIP